MPEQVQTQFEINIYRGEARPMAQPAKDWDVLRQQVQQLFNKKYQEATGKANARVPYGKYRQTFEVTGLPGVVFKKPNSYGRSNLTKILDCKNITFQVARSIKYIIFDL